MFNDASLYMLHGPSAYSFEEYYELSHAALIALNPGVTTEGIYYGVLGQRLETVGNSIGKNFFYTWDTLDLDNPQALLDDIKSMLIRNNPTIMSVNGLDSSSEDHLKFYKIWYNSAGVVFADTGYSFNYDNRWASDHYFIVTGLIYDNHVDEVYLRVSNAGREEYIIYSEYVAYVRNHGVIGGVNPGNAIIYYWEA